MLSQEKAEILGLLFSDGNYRKYHSTFRMFDKRRNKTYTFNQDKRIMEFANTDLELLEYFRKLLDREYNYYPNIVLSNKNVFRVCITKNSVLDDLTGIANFGSSEWFIPSEIVSGNDQIKRAFIRGFFDGDGSVDFAEKKIPRIRINSINLNGLKQIRELLKSLSIESKVNGPYKRNKRKDCYELLLKTSSVIKFIKYINSKHSKKRGVFQKISQGKWAQGLVKNDE
jgi:DNA-binding transcriptional regulator WhiA